MNVLIVYPVGNALNPYAGLETRTWLINSALIKGDFNVSILHSIKSKGLEDEKLKKKCNVYYYKDTNFFGLSDRYYSDFNPFYLYKLFIITRKKNIDAIQLERIWGFLIIKLIARRRTILICDSQLIESKYIGIDIKAKRIPKIFKHFIIWFARIYEKLVIRMVDVLICLSEIDREYFIKNFKIKRSKTILLQTPSTINLQTKPRSERLKKECRKKLGLPMDKTIAMFHGGFPHQPNKEALDLIRNYISPNIKNPDILFVVAGHNLEKFKENNVLSLGFVEDLKDLLYSSDLAIVPIISGYGMRTKCMDYIMTGLPFIITKTGIEGIDFLEPDVDFLLYNSVNEEFLEGINLLHNDNHLRQKFEVNLIKKSKFFNRSMFENRFIKLYNRLKNNR
ncbi:MAG: glycosyltransferase [Promethearchaeota archaeon]